MAAQARKKKDTTAASGASAANSKAGRGVDFKSGMQANAPSEQRNLQLKPGDLKKQGKKKTLREPLKRPEDDSSKLEKAEQATKVAGELQDNSSNFQDIKTAGEQWANTAKPDQEPADGGLLGYLAKALGLKEVLDVFSGLSDFAGLFRALAVGKDKYQKFRAFSKAQLVTKKKPEEAKLYQVALFAAKRAGWAFVDAFLNIAENIVSVMGTILALVPPAEPVAVTLKGIVAIGGGIKKLYKGVKSGWNKLWGLDKKKEKQRKQKTGELLDLAVKGDVEAAQLLLNLGLTFVIKKKFTGKSAPKDLCNALKQLQAESSKDKAAKASWDSLHKELERAMESDV